MVKPNRWVLGALDHPQNQFAVAVRLEFKTVFFRNALVVSQDAVVDKIQRRMTHEGVIVAIVGW
jgi:hypothetical protein